MDYDRADYRFLDIAISKLPPKQQFVVHNRILGNTKCKVIAKQLHISIPRVCQLQHQALTNLEKWFIKHSIPYISSF